MKKCPDCGKEYPDDILVCPSDRIALVVSEMAVLPNYSKPHTIIIRRFTVGSIFKIVAIGCTISLFGFSLLMGFLALFGAHTVNWNRNAVTGAAGLMTSAFLGGMMVIVFTLLGWIGFAISFWVFSKFGSLKLDYIADKEAGQTNEA